jgi:hypothetical protein
MASQLDRTCTNRSRMSPVTTLLASGWGLISAYILFTSLLNHASSLKVKCFTLMAALFPLIAVWATIERKRWGRLALLGMCASALCLCFGALSYYLWLSSQGSGLTSGVPESLSHLPFFDSPYTLGALVVLAVANSIWLRSPRAIAEFEQNKRPALAVAQRVIATLLVGCWSVIMIASTHLPNGALHTSILRSAASCPKPGTARTHRLARHRRRATPLNPVTMPAL